MAAEAHHREIDLVSQIAFEKISPESALGINRIERENSEFLRSAILQFLETAPSP